MSESLKELLNNEDIEGLDKYIGQLTAENADLRAKLEKALDENNSLKLDYSHSESDGQRLREVYEKTLARAEQAEDDSDQDWMNAIQSKNWGGEISLAEGNDCAPDARREVIDSIYQLLVESQLAKEQAESKCAERWTALAHAEEYLNICEPSARLKFILMVVAQAKKDDCGTGYHLPEDYAALEAKVKVLREALEKIERLDIGHSSGACYHMKDIAKQARAETKDSE